MKYCCYTAPCTPANVSHTYSCETGIAFLSWQETLGRRSFYAHIRSGDHVASCSTNQTHCVLPSLLCGRTYDVEVTSVAQHCNSSVPGTTQMTTGELIKIVWWTAPRCITSAKNIGDVMVVIRSKSTYLIVDIGFIFKLDYSSPYSSGMGSFPMIWCYKKRKKLETSSLIFFPHQPPVLLPMSVPPWCVTKTLQHWAGRTVLAPFSTKWWQIAPMVM